MAENTSTKEASQESAVGRGERQQRIERAFFRGDELNLEHPGYRQAVLQLMDELLRQDLAAGDLTASALQVGGERVRGEILAREEGVIAGLAELAELYGKHGIAVTAEKKDGEAVAGGDVVLHGEGEGNRLLALERTGLNLLQRMSGIASAARRLQDCVRRSGSSARIVGTRKTPWGLLDKRALYLGGVGTHRLGLGDAILVKNNHLALMARNEEDAAPSAIERAWEFRDKSVFIEVEVRSEPAARAAANAFRRLREGAREEYPCVLMLDNMSPNKMRDVVRTLYREGLWDDVLVEASGGISESNIAEYAVCGADVISVGALTHSARALDLSQRVTASRANASKGVLE